MVGAHAPSLGSGQEGGLPERGTSLIYFYSPDCGPCRKMTPLVRQLDARYGRVKRVDVSQDLETARSYQVRAVPTTVLVEDGRISKVLIGFQSLAKLEGLLSADG
jgi:thioredoxin 1